MPSRKTATRRTHQYTLKISLRDVRPPVWRRVLVPGGLTLGELHVVIQVAMGWEGGHLHEFIIGGARYGLLLDDDWEMDEELLDEDEVTLDELGCGEGAKFQYLYDFGDGWRHEVKVEKREVVAPQDQQLACLKGMRACPPEDCGGPFAYMRAVASLQGQGEPLDEYMAEVYEDFDPAHFDLAAVNAVFAGFWQEE